MIWLELRANSSTYKSGWNFTESVWAPTKKANGSEWPFWNLVGQVVKGDIIFHLREINNEKIFTGYSIASSDGYITHEIPTTTKHDWDFTESCYRADLSGYQPLNPTIRLADFFRKRNKQLRSYFENNRAIKHNKQRLFYVIQNNNLQCLNGAYFSDLGPVLSQLLIDDFPASSLVSEPKVQGYTNTGTVLTTLSQRIGHQQFSDNVKKNYSHKCCFPNCEVEGNGFLISGHIARWADNETSRGDTSNGLCMCLMHDKAFEKGLFTLTKDFKVKLLFDKKTADSWLNELLSAGESLEIKDREINPSVDVLKLHWKRIGYKPRR